MACGFVLPLTLCLRDPSCPQVSLLIVCPTILAETAGGKELLCAKRERPAFMNIFLPKKMILLTFLNCRARASPGFLSLGEVLAAWAQGGHMKFPRAGQPL